MSALAAATGTAKTAKLAECEASQSGGEAVTPNLTRRQTLMTPTEEMIEAGARAERKWNERPTIRPARTEAIYLAMHKARPTAVADEAERLMFSALLKRGIDQDTADQAAQEARAAIEAISPHVGEESLKLGDPVEVVSDKPWALDWKGWQGFVAGIAAEPGGGTNITVSETWPPAQPGDLTDGFEPGDLRVAALKTGGQ